MRRLPHCAHVLEQQHSLRRVQPRQSTSTSFRTVCAVPNFIISIAIDLAGPCSAARTAHLCDAATFMASAPALRFFPPAGKPPAPLAAAATGAAFSSLPESSLSFTMTSVWSCLTTSREVGTSSRSAGSPRGKHLRFWIDGLQDCLCLSLLCGQPQSIIGIAVVTAPRQYLLLQVPSARARAVSTTATPAQQHCYSRGYASVALVE